MTRRKKYRYLQDWEVQAIVDAAKAGEKVAALAVEFGATVGNIYNVIYRNGLNRGRVDLSLAAFRREWRNGKHRDRDWLVV